MALARAGVIVMLSPLHGRRLHLAGHDGLQLGGLKGLFLYQQVGDDVKFLSIRLQHLFGPTVGPIDDLAAQEAGRLATSNGYNVHPCGSWGDSRSIGDFAVGLNAGQVRAADHNRLQEIEETLGASALWMGKRACKGWRHVEEGAV
ncbi:MAG: hypothetical protein U9R48_05270 [Chloroflexota bacterium]|nr:hypothetical protein [Chloroflexota bacterium]